MDRGVLILAMGNRNYGRMAVMLAASLKATGASVRSCLHEDVRIHLAWQGDAIKNFSAQEMALFNSISEVPDEYTLKGGKRTYFKAKTFMYDLSPFDETLYIDADVIWFERKVSELFDELLGAGFAMENSGYYDFAHPKKMRDSWVSRELVRQAYGFTDEHYYEYHSELVYFTKCEANRQYFKTAQLLFDDLKVQPEKFAGDIPDEVAFSIASCLLKHYPQRDNWHPVYFYPHKKDAINERQNLMQNYWALSAGGKMITSPKVRDLYKALAIRCCEPLGIQPYSLVDKRAFDNTRMRY